MKSEVLAEEAEKARLEEEKEKIISKMIARQEIAKQQSMQDNNEKAEIKETQKEELQSSTVKEEYADVNLASKPSESSKWTSTQRPPQKTPYNGNLGIHSSINCGNFIQFDIDFR